MRYFVEFSFDDGQGASEITCTSFVSRKAAMARAREMSRLNDGSIFYVLDEDRTGHIAYVSGAIDHKEGAAI